MAESIGEDSPGQDRVDADSVQTRSYDLEQLDRDAEEARLTTQARAALELELEHSDDERAEIDVSLSGPYLAYRLSF